MDHIFVMSLDELRKIPDGKKLNKKDRPIEGGKKIFQNSLLSTSSQTNATSQSKNPKNKILVNRRNTTTQKSKQEPANDIASRMRARISKFSAGGTGKKDTLSVKVTTMKSTTLRKVGVLGKVTQQTKTAVSTENSRVQRFGQLLRSNIQESSTSSKAKNAFTTQNRLELRKQRFALLNNATNPALMALRKQRFASGKASELSDAEKSELRKQRFAPKEKKARDPTEPSLLLQRQKRFGTNSESLTENQKNSDRTANFAEMFNEKISKSVKEEASPLSQAPSSAQRMALRAAKFGVQTKPSTISTAPTQTSEAAKRLARAAKFGTAAKDFKVPNPKKPRVSI